MEDSKNMNAEKMAQDAPEAVAGMDTATAAEYKSLTFYFDRLTGEDVEAVELELQQRNIIVLDATVSSAFQCGIAARASGIGADEIARLPLRHYLKIKNAARDFLVAVGY